MFDRKIRELKLKLIDGDIDLKIDKSMIRKNRKILNFIHDNMKETDIIIGSLALSLFGLLNENRNLPK